VSGPLPFVDALALAQSRGALRIWHQQLDRRGRPVSTPVCIAADVRPNTTT
jgi:hypothetical protein